MSDTQDTLIEQVARAWASIDGKAELFDSEKEADGYGTGVYMGYVAEADELLKRSGLATALADSDAKIAELREHSHQRAEDLRTLAAQVAELTQKLERATALVAKFVRCNDEGPGLIDCIDNDGERYTSQFFSDTVREARALNSGASQNG